jgi:hypothetical protein
MKKQEQLMYTFFIGTLTLLIIGCNSRKDAEPSWDGQSFQSECMWKIRDLKELDTIVGQKYKYRICNCVRDIVIEQYPTELEASIAFQLDKNLFITMLNDCLQKVKAALGK